MFDGELTANQDANMLERMLTRSASLLQARGCGVLLWDEEKGQLTAMAPFSGLNEEQLKELDFSVTGAVLGVAITGDGSRGIAASGDGTLRVWDLNNDTSVAVLKGHRSAIYSVAISDDGRTQTTKALTTPDNHVLGIRDCLEKLSVDLALRLAPHFTQFEFADGSGALSLLFGVIGAVFILFANRPPALKRVIVPLSQAAAS